jgi:predicted dehydrogenase
VALQLALVGCGGMGLRHLHGIAEAVEKFGSFDLIAVCDRHEAAAMHVASEAERLMGRRPAVFTDFTDMLERSNHLDAVDIVTDNRMHHVFGIEALDAGVNVITEKPMGITVKACEQMAEAVRRSGKTLAVAENYRRDPMNRLAKALIEQGAVGSPYFLLDVGVGGGSALMHDTGWRALKSRGGSLILERGVHVADLLVYFMGDVKTVYAVTGVFQKVRRRGSRGENVVPFYSHRTEDQFAGEDEVVIDAEDTALAVLTFESGAVCQMTMSNASHGHSVDLSSLHGSEGTLLLPPSRSGIGPKIKIEGRVEPIEGDELLALVPDWELDGVTARLWNDERRFASYDMPFEEIDRKIIAVELQDFAEAVMTGREPEVDMQEGKKALALSYAVLESGERSEPIEFADVMERRIEGYQADINSELGV